MSGDSVYAHVDAVTSAARRLRTSMVPPARPPCHHVLGHAGAEAAMHLIDVLASKCESTKASEAGRIANAVELIAAAVTLSDGFHARQPLAVGSETGVAL